MRRLVAAALTTIRRVGWQADEIGRPCKLGKGGYGIAGLTQVRLRSPDLTPAFCNWIGSRRSDSQTRFSEIFRGFLAISAEHTWEGSNQRPPPAVQTGAAQGFGTVESDGKAHASQSLVRGGRARTSSRTHSIGWSLKLRLEHSVVRRMAPNLSTRRPARERVPSRKSGRDARERNGHTETSRQFPLLHP
jgi:hypothetical protein